MAGRVGGGFVRGFLFVDADREIVEAKVQESNAAIRHLERSAF